jgi:hypothetical protein
LNKENFTVKFFYMKTVISASRRTDIPAFYLEWFINAIKAGYVDVINPIFKKQTYRVDLMPDQVEWIVFWSRNYGKYIERSQFFTPYRLFFHFTILSYHPLLEKVELGTIKALQQMEQLVKLYGADHIIWRYDPIVAWRDGAEIITNFNAAEYEYLCIELSRMEISRCYFSFVSLYQKFKRRFTKRYPQLQLISEDETFIKEICNCMTETAGANGIQLYSCCNDYIISESIQKGSCISGSLLNDLSGEKNVSEAKAPSRPQCGCTRSVDIGSYANHPCPYGCIYCYANPVV